MTERNEIQNSNPVEYGKWLKKELCELGITQKELAEELGVTIKIADYIKGKKEDMPASEVIEQIDCFLLEKSCFNGFYHMSNDSIRKLIDDFMKEYDLTQLEVEEIIGVGQKYICALIYHSKSMGPFKRTEGQYHIITKINNAFKGEYYFNRRHHISNNLIKPHMSFNTVNTNNSIISFRPYALADKGDYREYSVTKEISILEKHGENYARMIGYYAFGFYKNIEISNQMLILKYPNAFIECSRETEYYRRYDYHSYKKRVEAFNNYREIVHSLDSNGLSVFVSQFINAEPTLYPFLDDSDLNYIKTIDEMKHLSIGINNKNRLFSEEDTKAFACDNEKIRKVKEDNYIEFKKLSTYLGCYSQVIDELMLKQSFDTKDWFLWRLLLIDAHNRAIIFGKNSND